MPRTFFHQNAALCEHLRMSHQSTDQPNRSPTPSGHAPHTRARLGSLPLSGASTFSLFRLSSTSATYTKPMTLASRIFSCESLGSACTMARIAFCICGEGSILSKIGGLDEPSVSSPGRKESRNGLAVKESVGCQNLESKRLTLRKSIDTQLTEVE